MLIKEYQTKCLDTDLNVIIENDPVIYYKIKLMSEIGEFSEKIVKCYRDGVDIEDIKESLKKEIGDVLWYLFVVHYKIILTEKTGGSSRNSEIDDSLSFLDYYNNSYRNIIEFSKYNMNKYSIVNLCEILTSAGYSVFCYNLFIKEDKFKELFDNLLNVVYGICIRLGFTVEDACVCNLDKLQDRKNRNVLQGSGDNR